MCVSLSLCACVHACMRLCVCCVRSTRSNQFPLFRSAVKPEESQYTEIELNDNPSYESVGGEPHKQESVYESVDTYN